MFLNKLLNFNFIERGKEKIKFKILKTANTNTASKTDL